MDLLVVDRVAHRISGDPAGASRLASLVELFPMRWSISDVEDVPEARHTWEVPPAEVLGGDQKPIVDSFWEISSAERIKGTDVVSDLAFVGEILDLSYVGALLGRVVPVGDDSEAELDAFGLHLSGDVVDDVGGSLFSLGDVGAHGAGGVDAETDIDDSEGWDGEGGVVF